MTQCRKCRAALPDDAVYCCYCGLKQAQERRAKTRGNGAGTAYKRGKTWTGQAAGYSYVEVGADGKPHRTQRRPTKGGFKTKTEALAWAAAQGGRKKSEAPTLLDLWQGWSQNEMQKLSKDKIVAYKKARERLESIIAQPIDRLTLDDIQKVVNSEAKSYYTARDMKTLLSHLYNRAMARGGGAGSVTVNISRFIVLPELEEKEPVPFGEEEVSAIWAAWESGEVFAGYLLLMIYSSMMPAELFACKISMIDYERHEIYGCGRKTKKRKDVPIVFPAFISPVLEKLAEVSTSKSGGLWAGNKDSFYKKYHEFTANAGIRDLPPYSCRHTTATEAVKKGVELPVIQQIMRHSKLSSTERYIHVSTAAAHEAINKLDGKLD